VDAIRSHIKLLSAKDYHKLENLNTLDFVLMFLPVEAAFTVAVQEEPNLFSEAFDRNVMLVGPSNLLAILRTIQNIWRYEYQNKNALDIANRAGLLYDKFVSFHESLQEVGKHIDRSQAAHEQAVSQLTEGRGNLVGQVEKLKTLGARASKQLPDKALKIASDDPDEDSESQPADNQEEGDND
jgi:DNA recombination protein RmuC